LADEKVVVVKAGTEPIGISFAAAIYMIILANSQRQIANRLSALADG
jgi:hypothetical protein